MFVSFVPSDSGSIPASHLRFSVFRVVCMCLLPDSVRDPNHVNELMTFDRVDARNLRS